MLTIKKIPGSGNILQMELNCRKELGLNCHGVRPVARRSEEVDVEVIKGIESRGLEELGVCEQLCVMGDLMCFTLFVYGCPKSMPS